MLKTKNIYMALCLAQILCYMLIYNNESIWFNEYVCIDNWKRTTTQTTHCTLYYKVIYSSELD